MIGKELLEGQRVRLTALGGDDAAVIAAWYQDAAFMRLFDGATAFPLSTEQVMERIKGWQKSQTDYLFAVRPIDVDNVVGLVGITEVSWRNRSGFLEIAVGPKHWRQGYGSEALRLILGYGFGELNLHRVQLTVFEYNEVALRLYEKAGFQREGVFREAIYRDGHYYPMILMGLLAQEWLERQGE